MPGDFGYPIPKDIEYEIILLIYNGFDKFKTFDPDCINPPYENESHFGFANCGDE
jgi:hypothetical protein